MPHINKLILVVTLILIALFSNYGQDKSALKYIEEVKVKVEITYFSGDKDDYKSLLLYESGIISEVIHMLESAGIQVDQQIETPKLLLKVTVDHNLKSKSSGDDSWYYVTSDIYIIDRVKIKEHPSIIIDTITWQGDGARESVDEINVGDISNKRISEIVKSFLNDYMEVHPD